MGVRLRACILANNIGFKNNRPLLDLNTDPFSFEGPVSASIHLIRTASPSNRYAQEKVGEAMAKQLDPTSKGARLARKIYRSSGIDFRHSVIGDLNQFVDQVPVETEGLFFDTQQTFLSPTTGVRNAMYSEHARTLFSEVAASLIDDCPTFSREDVTHVITVSCTGFFAPGPDYYVVKDLGLDTSTKRFHIGFMGCYAAFPALKMAKAFCAEDPNAVVLVVCVELCSLHLEPSEDIDDIIATSVFADGASGAIVSAKPGPSGAKTLRLDFLESVVAPDSEGDMAWTIGDKGFDMVLSTYVPRILEAHVDEIVDGLLKKGGTNRGDISHWAIHPGGRAILDKVESGLSLPASALDPSRTVLRENGNMSSATIFFVLKQFQDAENMDSGAKMVAMAFGPGLTVESALMTVV